jgi:hypothetical protein
MQFLNIDKNMTLSQLNNRVGSKNTNMVLQQNNLPRVHNIGQAYQDMCETVSASYTEVGADGVTSNTVSYSRKMSILNNYTSDAEIFEAVSLQSEDGWKLLSTVGTMSEYIRMPDLVQLPNSSDILGGAGDNPVSSQVYSKAMRYLEHNLDIDPVIFNTYSDRQGTYTAEAVNTDVFQWFKIPWGEVTLHSSLSNISMDLPVYPDYWEDERSANYDTMPDMLYQYEPWQVYKSSGPRSNTYTFKMHRDMWSGDHRDGRCMELIRFCEANCFPVFSGAVVNTPIVTLYIHGQVLISGILTSVRTQYSGPIGHDSLPLYVEMSLSITEVSKEPLNYNTVMRKGVIG